MEIRSAFRTRVINLSRVPMPGGSEQQKISTAQLDQAIDDAVQTYSDELPLETSVELTTNSSGVYTLTDVVGAWGEGYHLVDVVQSYAGERVPLDNNHWEIYSLAGVDTLKISPRAYGAPDYQEQYFTNASTHLIYSYPHTLHDSVAGSTTIRSRDINAVASLAGAIACEMMAAEAADQKASGIPNSPVNYGGIQDKWLKQADRLRKRWDEHVSKFQSVADAWGEWDIQTIVGRPLFHGRRWH